MWTVSQESGNLSKGGKEQDLAGLCRIFGVFSNNCRANIAENSAKNVEKRTVIFIIFHCPGIVAESKCRDRSKTMEWLKADPGRRNAVNSGQI